MYKINYVADIIVDTSAVWGDCKIEYFMLSMGKTVTSVSGFLNTLTNYFWRQFSTTAADQAIYSEIS